MSLIQRFGDAILLPMNPPSQKAVPINNSFCKTPGSRFGSKLREWRKRKGWTGKVLVEQMGTYGNAISSWERGIKHPTIENCHRLASALDLPLQLVLDELERSKKESRDIEIRIRRGESLQNVSDSIGYDPNPGDRMVYVQVALPMDILKWVRKGAQVSNMSTSAYLSRPIARSYYAKRRGINKPISYDDGPELTE